MTSGLIIHLVAYVLRRLRWLALVWIVVCSVLPFVAAGIVNRAASQGAEWFSLFGPVLYVPVVAQGVFAWLLIGNLISSDPLTGSSAGWVTRPIGGGRLLVAKGIIAGLLFVGVPLLSYVPWWIACGAGGAVIGGSLGAAAQSWGLLVLAAVSVAVLTRTTRTFAFASLVVVACVWVASSMTATTGSHAAGVSIVLMILLAAGVMHQFLTRRTSRTSGMLLGVLALALVLAQRGGWRLVAMAEPTAFPTCELDLEETSSSRANGIEVLLCGVSEDEGDVEVGVVWNLPAGLHVDTNSLRVRVVVKDAAGEGEISVEGHVFPSACVSWLGGQIASSRIAFELPAGVGASTDVRWVQRARLALDAR